MRKINHFLFTVLFSLLMLLGYSQQDSQYTQYMYNTNTINPAFVGSRGVVSIFGMYRTQWVGLDGAPDTGVFSVHSPLGEREGLGFTFINDRIGISDESTFSADFSHTIPVGRDYKLAFGLKGSVHLLNVDYSKLDWDDSSDFINNDIVSRISPNIGAGVYLYSEKFYAGISMPNILETEHYSHNSRSTAKERMHGYLITGYIFDLNQNVLFKPAILTKAVTGSPLQVDISGNFMFNEKFILGAAWRWGAAISGLAGFQATDNLFIGYSYDSETSKLANYNSGSHEIFLRFEFYGKNDCYCPKF